jgi:hypothetical protein
LPAFTSVPVARAPARLLADLPFGDAGVAARLLVPTLEAGDAALGGRLSRRGADAATTPLFDGAERRLEILTGERPAVTMISPGEVVEMASLAIERSPVRQRRWRVGQAKEQNAEHGKQSHSRLLSPSFGSDGNG